MARTVDILVVEDDPADAELLLRALARVAPDAVVERARDAEAALNALAAEGLWPRIVLLDLKLPGMTGMELLRIIRSTTQFRTLPVVVFTSSAEPRDLEGAYELGANGYAQKPVDFAAFAEVVQRICGFWLDVNRTAAPA